MCVRQTTLHITPTNIVPQHRTQQKQKTGGAAVCASDASGVCLGPTLAVAAPVTTCAVDACFALDASGALTPQQWRLQAGFVENVIRLMGALGLG